MVKRFEGSVWLYVVIQHPPQGEGLVKAQDLYCTEEVMNREWTGFTRAFACSIELSAVRRKGRDSRDC